MWQENAEEIILTLIMAENNSNKVTIGRNINEYNMNNIHKTNENEFLSSGNEDETRANVILLQLPCKLQFIVCPRDWTCRTQTDCLAQWFSTILFLCPTKQFIKKLGLNKLSLWCHTRGGTTSVSTSKSNLLVMLGQARGGTSLQHPPQVVWLERRRSAENSWLNTAYLLIKWPAGRRGAWSPKAPECFGWAVWVLSLQQTGDWWL